MKLELHEDKGGSHRWRLRSTNGQVIASGGEAFSSVAKARNAAKNFAAKAEKWEYEVYADKGGKHRWRAKATNGQIVGSSGEAFASQSNARRAAKNIRERAAKATVA